MHLFINIGILKLVLLLFSVQDRKMSSQCIDFLKLFEQLQRDDLRSEALNNIKNTLICNANETVNTLKESGWTKLFNCLKIDDGYVYKIFINALFIYR